MDRMACVDLPAFPLQLLVNKHPDWKELPVAVVDRDKPTGVILWVNEAARRFHILPGLHYAAGLSLSPELRAGEVSEDSINEAVAHIIERLRFFTPGVEPSPNEPGVLWLDASGLSRLFESLKRWAAMIREDLTGAGYHARVSVGFTRFGTYAAVKVRKKLTLFADLEEEQAGARNVEINRLGFHPDLRDPLFKLGITTLGQFIDLPSTDIRKRFGDDAHRWYQLAKGELWSPLVATPPPDPVRASIDLNHPETDLERLMVTIGPLLEKMLAELGRRSHSLSAITVAMTFDQGGNRTERLVPAAPTLEMKELLTLIRLRLESIELPSGVVELDLDAESARTRHHQDDMFAVKPKRDPLAVRRAFARLRAELGEDAVMHARLKEGHLPEAHFDWEKMENIPAELKPRKVRLRPLIRRILTKPTLLSNGRWRWEPVSESVRAANRRGRARADAGIRRHLMPFEQIVGPYFISGGWWRKRVSREYYFVRTESGQWLWVFYDHRRKRLFLQGEVA